MNSKHEPSATAGELDPGFGENGTTSLDTPDPNYPFYNSNIVAVSTDNKTYVAGTAYKDPNLSINTLARLNTDGSIDKTFADNGFFHGQFGNSDQTYLLNEEINFLENKILLIGRLFNFDSGELFIDKAAICFNENGSINKEFGTQGIFLFRAPEDNPDEHSRTACAQVFLEKSQSLRTPSYESSTAKSHKSSTSLIAEDRIFLIHTAGSFEHTNSYIVCIDHNGVLDPTFNGSGFNCAQHPIYPHLKLFSLTIDNHLDYLCGGEVRVDYHGEPDAIVLAKYKKDGTLDKNYQKDGFLLIADLQSDKTLYLSKLVKQPNNRTLGIGITVDKNSLAASGLLFSLENDGTRNIQFNSGKDMSIQLGSVDTDFIDAKFLPDGRFFTSAIRNNFTADSRYAVARFLFNGTLDTRYADGAGYYAYSQVKSSRYESTTLTDNDTIVLNLDGAVTPSAIGRGLLS
ncbi:delta-60 repeat domain-containing protein [Pseudomonas sp. BW7P1]|uniref:delta-60 repeat domain-containing protein n=1 Tax=Pseudomonas TaxID=286 RepID=UPI0021AD60EC|nr:delta-60 repeat domain-containing protein [Pseudomonas sp. BW7P1]UWI60764.1 delta-60 repeat domain-containing protein [Pseudomonas sp. BW7P1]